MKAVIYARYSPGPNQTEQSIEGQLRECEKFAKDNDIAVVGTYIDRAQTGRNDNRADFQRMLHDSKRHMFEAVIVWKVDRFGRNREEIAKNKAIFRMNGVRVLYAKEHIPDGPEGIILESVLEGLAEYYSANLSQNIIRGMRESALKCQYNGSGLAIGYKVDAEKKFHIDDEAAAIVRTIFEMYDGGHNYTQIIKMLTDKGLKTNRGKDFNHMAISRILQNRQYIGEYRWHDIVTPGGMPKIIDKALFERVQKRMEKNKKAPARKLGEREFLLTSKIFCGHCKSTMIGDSGTGKSGDKWYYYSCRKRKTKHTCKKRSVKKDALERLIVETTVNIVLQDDVIEFIADRCVEVQRKEHADKSMLNYYEGRLKETEAAIANIMKAIEKGFFNETSQSRMVELEATKEDMKIEIVKEKIVRPEFSREDIIWYLEQFKGGDIDDKEYQRKIIDMFVNKVVLYDDKFIITYNYSGERNEVSVDIIEEAALQAASEDMARGSDTFTQAPPYLEVCFDTKRTRKNPATAGFFAYQGQFSDCPFCV